MASAAMPAATLRPQAAHGRTPTRASACCRLAAPGLPVWQRQQQLAACTRLGMRRCQHPGRQQQQQQPGARRLHVCAAAAAATPAAASAASAAAQAFWPALVQAWNTNPAAVLMAAGACILGMSLSVFLLASIPTMLALRRSAHAMEALLHTVRAEVPDTAATLRLSGMELADCIQEIGGLGADLTDGVRASARAITNAEQGIRQAGAATGKALTEHVLPQARDKVEAALQERAKLGYTATVVREAAESTKTAVQRLRFVLAAGGLARGVARSARYLQREGRGGRGGAGEGYPENNGGGEYRPSPRPSAPPRL